MWQQLQSWATPEMFIRRGGGAKVETVETLLSLESLTALPALPRSVAEDSPGLANLSLVSVRSNGAFPSVQADSFGTSVALQTLVNIIPLSRSQSDNATGLLSLVSLNNIPNQTRTVSDTANGAISLQSLSV